MTRCFLCARELAPEDKTPVILWPSTRQGEPEDEGYILCAECMRYFLSLSNIPPDKEAL